MEGAAACATVRLVAWTGAFGPPRIRACTVDYYVAVYAGVGVWDWLVAREVRSERETGAICAPDRHVDPSSDLTTLSDTV